MISNDPSGHSVAVSHTSNTEIIAVGAYLEDNCGSGWGANAGYFTSRPGCTDTWCSYRIYEIHGATWTVQGFLKGVPPDPSSSSHLGTSVALHSKMLARGADKEDRPTTSVGEVTFPSSHGCISWRRWEFQVFIPGSRPPDNVCLMPGPTRRQKSSPALAIRTIVAGFMTKVILHEEV